MTQAFWDDKYRSRTGEWGGEPNSQLIAEASHLAPGVALDAGTGEGMDAMWLAARGWAVTAVDISAYAIERNARLTEAGPSFASRVRWQHADLVTWAPPASAFDLVSLQFIHLPPFERSGVFERLATAVAVDGTLLVVAHHPFDRATTMPRAGRPPDWFYTGDEIAAAIDPAYWHIVGSVARPRSATDPDGRTVIVHDTVFRARRMREPS